MSVGSEKCVVTAQTNQKNAASKEARETQAGKSNRSVVSIYTMDRLFSIEAERQYNTSLGFAECWRKKGYPGFHKVDSNYQSITTITRVNLAVQCTNFLHVKERQKRNHNCKLGSTVRRLSAPSLFTCLSVRGLV
ncbi:hypothetical protein COCMIDRAFT_80690 [Bipolaris oryzae ATCC 44560]|uniref:Uncharacterized protein n=1 Tax=Bipolaris oryzae ATCC 44560 TaxID=930090 RepID=W7A4D3_COCMI|nr:uncharacterized protein COCMIDRAFT_80690 [Bipolaris oryzae ATCC 44560]EUC50981.1 hypothetical protein COCMIDRAFT_80690 [Bipolaris oryzae ATCC 44560]